MLDRALLESVRRRVLAVLDRVAFLGPLLARITVGAVFLKTGWGKLHSLPDVTKSFASLGIPAPGFHAHLVATVEFGGGILLLLGLCARLAALPLIVTMTVAILTAKRDDIETWTSLFHFEEWLYLVVFVWIVVAGPGKASLDHLLFRRRPAP